MVLCDRLGRRRRFVTGIFVYPHRKGGLVSFPYRIGLEEIIILIESVITVLPEIGCRTGALLLESSFGKVISLVDRNVDAIPGEVLRELAASRNLIFYIADDKTFAGRHLIHHINYSALRLYLRDNLGIIISEILQMPFHILDRGLHQILIIHDRCGPDLAHDLAPQTSPAFCRKIIDIDQRIPSGFLPYI